MPSSTTSRPDSLKRDLSHSFSRFDSTTPERKGPLQTEKNDAERILQSALIESPHDEDENPFDRDVFDRDDEDPPDPDTSRNNSLDIPPSFYDLPIEIRSISER